MRAGKIDEIISLAHAYARNNQPVPFDIVYLAGADLELRGGTYHAVFRGSRTNVAFTAEVAGHFPLLAATWAYIDHEDDSLPDALRDAVTGVLPSTWTLLKPQQGQTLANWLERNAACA
jgi:hypothetical protein